MRPHLIPSQRQFNTSARQWAWLVVFLAICLCAGLAWLHFQERRTFDHALAQLDEVRQARLKLSHGFFDITMAAPHSPFVRSEGLARADSGLAALEVAGREMAPGDPELPRFDAALYEFQARLADMQRPGSPDSVASPALRAAFHALDEASDRLNESRRAAMARETARLDLFILIAFGGGLVLLAGGGVSLRMAGRRQKASEELRHRSEQALRDSDAHFRALTDAMPQIIWVADRRGIPVYLNQRARELAGDDPEKTWTEAVHPDDQAPLLEAWTRVVANAIPYQGQLRLRRPGSAEYRWHLARGVPMAGESDGDTRWYCTATDIHHQKTTESALRNSEERYRRLVEFLPDAVFINAGGKLSFCNPALVRLMGASSEQDLLGRAPFDLFHPDCHDQIRRRIDRMHRTGEPAPGVEQQLVRLDGRVVPVHVVATPIQESERTVHLVVLHDLTDRRRRDEMLRLIMENTVDGVVTIDATGRVSSFNPAAERVFGYRADEILGRNISTLMPSPHQQAHDAHLARYLATGEAHIIGIGREVEGLRNDGARFPMDLSVTEFLMGGERFFIGIVRDISERKKLEEQLRQSQKMEAIGLVAGGVAHDFNNLLTIISGYSELLMSRLEPDDPSVPHIRSIHKAGELAASLTRQLLVFSRRSVLEPRVLDLNAVVGETEKMLRRVIGEDIELTTLLAPELGHVTVDPGYTVQVLMNLVVNARDAMPTGGKLTIETANVVLDAAYVAACPEARPGPHVRIAVTDTGAGMTPEVLAHVFEPFFTTKGVGRGTGLGLAVVHGLVKQSGGHLTVYSEPGVGTTFQLYFPHATEAAAAPVAPVLESALRGSETILLVEDDERVRELARHALETHGYNVLPAGEGRAALDLAERHTAPIHLLLTDVVMPLMSGRELAETLMPRRAGMRLLYVSGYTDDAVVRHGILHAEVDFLQKPYTPTSLLGKVRQVLDRPPAPPDATESRSA